MNNCQSLTEAIEVSLANNRQIVYIKSESEEVAVTYSQLYQNACDTLSYLQSWGLQPGDELIIAVEDNEIFLNIFWACILGKIIAVPVAAANNDEHRLKIVNIWMVLRKPYLITNQKLFNDLEGILREKQLSDVAESIKSRVLFVHRLEKKSLPCTLYHASLEDIAFIQFSSGSTGDPKGVVLTHKNLLINICAIINCAQFTSNDVMLSWMPLTHDMGLIGFHLTPLVCGMNQYNIPTPLFIRRPIVWLNKASEHQATVLSSPNFGYKYFLSFFTPENTKNWDLSHVRLIFNGAEPISDKLCNSFLEEMSKYGLKRTAMYPVYGMAEASLAVTFPPLEEELKTVILDRNALSIGDRVKEVPREDPNSVTFVDVGYPIKDCYVRICNLEGKVLEQEIVGFIEIKGENVTSGYYNTPLATVEAFSEDGWLKTGDLGFFRNGRLVITGRAKDVIFINGFNYYSHDIESVAQEAVEGIKSGGIAACGIFNENEQREEIILFVLFKREWKDFLPLAIHIKKYIRLKMGLEVKEIIPVRKIPKTTSGKLMRFKLKERYQNGFYVPVLREINEFMVCQRESAKFVQNNDNIEEKLLEVWSELFENQTPGVDDNLFEIVCDSLLMAKFCVQIEMKNIAKVSIVDLFSHPSIRKLAGFIENRNSGDYNPISYLQLRLPQEYFYKEESNLKSNFIYVYKLPEVVLENLKSLSCYEKNRINSILLSLFIYHLFEISDQAEIAVQTMIKKENEVSTLVVNLNDICEISELVEWVDLKSAQHDGYTYSLDRLQNIKISKNSASIVPLFYSDNLLTTKTNLANIYDINLGINETNEGISLLFDYNTERLNGEKLEEFVRVYIKSISALTEKYRSKRVGDFAFRI